MRIINCLSSCASLAPDQTCANCSDITALVTMSALSITKQIQCPYITIEGFTSNINYIKKLINSNLPLSTK